MASTIKYYKCLALIYLLLLLLLLPLVVYLRGRERERVRTVRPSVLSLLTPRSSLTHTHRLHVRGSLCMMQESSMFSTTNSPSHHLNQIAAKSHANINMWMCVWVQRHSSTKSTCAFSLRYLVGLFKRLFSNALPAWSCSNNNNKQLSLPHFRWVCVHVCVLVSDLSSG